MKPNHLWASKTAAELARFDDETASVNLARAYLELAANLSVLEEIASTLARQIVAPVSGPGSNGIGAVGLTLDRLAKLKEKLAVTQSSETST